MTEGDAEAVRRLASVLGLDLDGETIDAYTSEVATVCEKLARIDAPGAADPAAEAVQRADDEHNALLYHCSLSGGSGALDGLTVAVKDNIAVAGVPMTCGSAAMEFTPDRSATVVRRLVDAGGAVVATTNMDEFALSPTGETCAHGPVRNPAVDGCIPGGSSSGSAAAVASGAVDVALGSDTGGSVRVPTSFCGVVGFKPTHGTVPRFGFVDLAPSLDHVGAIAGDVETAARTLEAIAGATPEDPSTLGREPPSIQPGGSDLDAEELHVGVVEEAMGVSDDGVAETVSTCLEGLEGAGPTVEPVSMSDYTEAPLALLGTLAPEFAGLAANNGQVYGTGTGYSGAGREAMAAAVATGNDSDDGDLVRDTLVVGPAADRSTDGRLYAAAQRLRGALIDELDDCFGEFDALVTPTTPVPAPGFGEVDDALLLIANTAPFSLSGQPALSVPCGRTGGKPVGLQIATERYAEATAVRLGSLVESVSRSWS